MIKTVSGGTQQEVANSLNELHVQPEQIITITSHKDLIVAFYNA